MMTEIKVNPYCYICGKAVNLYAGGGSFYKGIPQKTLKKYRHWVACSRDHADQIEEKKE